jgi:hypothetical protein
LEPDVLVVRIEEWPGGDADLRRPIARLEIANRSGLAPVSDYEVTLRPAVGEPSRPAIVYGHVRDDGWLKLARAALRAVDPDGAFYTSPVTQVPADVLDLLPLTPYTSRACQTGRAILAAGPELDGLLAARGLERQAWAGEFFRSCRVTEKWTGMRCQDPQHGGGAPTDVAPSTWTVTTTVTAPTPGDAEHWAGTLRDLQLAEHGKHMQLDIVVAPVVSETPHAAFQQRQMERGLAMLAEDDAECGFVWERWDGPYRMRDRCTGPAGHAASWTAEGHGPWEMLADAPDSAAEAATGKEPVEPYYGIWKHAEAGYAEHAASEHTAPTMEEGQS